ncbi:MAG: hypothetical protein Q8N88_07375, partial [Nanoarchaeota archaeon]|nr:hypothetical protein [Nanoarchaeota archaeon]
MEIKNILFICKHNAFRSKIAENYFNQINKNKNVVAMSSGVFPAKLADLPLGLMKKFGFKIITPPRPTTPDILKNQDLVIIVADDIPKDLFNHNQKFYGFLKDKVI